VYLFRKSLSERDIIQGIPEETMYNKKSPRGIGPHSFSPSPQGAKYIMVTQDMGPSGVNF